MRWAPRLRRGLREIVAACGDLLLPEFCLLCDSEDVLDWPRRLCADCAGAIVLQEPARSCPICGLPAAALPARRRPCLACRRRRPAYTSLALLGPYEGTLARLLRLLKYEPRRAAALPLADLAAALALELAASGELAGIDLVLPVPLARDRLGRRGFNQAAEIAAGLPAVLGASLRPRWARRLDGGHQVGRGRGARRRLSSSIFRVDPRVYGRRVLVVDDVVTTGATLRAFAAAVRKAGARELRALAVARTPRSR